ncbi:MAG: endonuclease I [Pseudomonadota bacterium]|nr:endonuclease I [Pseudomonadota bacterium]
MVAPTARKTRTSSSSQSPRDRAIANGYRSGLEDDTASYLQSLGIPVVYENPESRINYLVEETRRYTPDFELPNGIIVETKGRFTSDDRKKHLLIKAQHPEKDIRFVFSRSTTKLNKTSKTSYADWCRKYGFLFADKKIPIDWVRETK